MSYQVDSYGNAYFPAGVSVASIPATTGTQAKVLVPGVNGRISSATVAQLITQSGGNLVSSVFGRTGVVTAQFGDYNSDQIQEGRYALYFSTSRVRKSIDLTTFNTSGPATYDSYTGILNIPQYGSGSGGNYVPLTRTITINGQTADLSVNRIFSVAPMVYPSAGIALSTGTAWDTSIVNNSANWNTAYTDRMKWDGGATGLVAATGRTSLGLVIGTDVLAYRTFGTAANSAATDFALAVHTHTIANVTGLQTALDGKEPTITAGTNLQYWRGDKSWQTLPIYANFTRTVAGLVPNPGAATTNRYLREDGTWVIPPDNDTIYVHPTTAGNKHIPAGGVAGEILRWSADGTATWGADIDTNTWNANTKTADGYVTAPGTVANKVWKTDGVGNPAWRDDADTTYTLAGLGGLPLAGGIMTGAITLKEGAANGLKFPNDVFGGSGDTAGMRLIARSGEAMSLEVYLTNDADDWFNISVPSDSGAKVNGNTIWHAGNLTNLNQLTNGPGYISSYSETDTLGSVTNRGNSTSQNLVFSNGRKGLIGVYDAAQTQAIFAMGAAYILTDGGASNNIGNLYGLAWSYNPDYGGAGNNPQSKAGLNHQLLLMQNGVTTAAMGSGIWTSGNVTASTFIGSIAWTSVTGRPTALSQFSNDLGNYGGWVVRTGDSMSGRLTIDSRSSTNLPLHILSVEPYMQIEAVGATNSTAVKMYSTGGYGAYIGNYATGELVLVAAGTEVAYLNSNSIRVAKYRFNGNSTLSGSGTPEIVDIANVGMAMQSLNYKWYNNSANVLYMTLDYNGNLTANAFFESSDIRYKDIIETNPNITLAGLDVIKFTRKGNSIIRYGYSAQQVKSLSEDLVGGTKDDMTVNYSDVHTLKIAALEKRIAELEAKLK